MPEIVNEIYTDGLAGDRAAAAPPPFCRSGSGTLPLVIAVPHAGRHYPAEIDAARAVGWRQLRALEDRYADRLVDATVAAGAVAIVAGTARAWLDLNRDEADRDHAPASAHGAAGLGLIPQRIGGRALWRRPLAEQAILGRVATLHRPYHQAIDQALATARRRHGHALLIDCHSMPPIRGARLVIGDLHGISAAPAIVAALLAEAQTIGLGAALNRPYAGAYSLARHGRPERGVHAVQLEFDRSLYLDRGLDAPTAAVAEIAGHLLRLATAALAAAGRVDAEPPPPRIAAE